MAGMNYQSAHYATVMLQVQRKNGNLSVEAMLIQQGTNQLLTLMCMRVGEFACHIPEIHVHSIPSRH
jgi:hypothetical protein